MSKLAPCLDAYVFFKSMMFTAGANKMPSEKDICSCGKSRGKKIISPAENVLSWKHTWFTQTKKDTAVGFI